jgi:hypothetical protein
LYRAECINRRARYKRIGAEQNVSEAGQIPKDRTGRMYNRSRIKKRIE